MRFAVYIVFIVGMVAIIAAIGVFSTKIVSIDTHTQTDNSLGEAIRTRTLNPSGALKSGCFHECSLAGTLLCHKQSVYRCVAIDGCRILELVEDCGDFTCENATCTTETCQDECVVGEQGCFGGSAGYCSGPNCTGHHNWVCDETDDGDDCLDIRNGYCSSGEHCGDGTCFCVDECVPGQEGCSLLSDDRTGIWTCGESDGDSCHDIINPLQNGLICADDEVCDFNLAECVCRDMCAPGERGCDGRDAWLCGEANDGDDCLDRVTHTCQGQCSQGRCSMQEPDPPPTNY